MITRSVGSSLCFDLFLSYRTYAILTGQFNVTDTVGQ